MLEAIPERSVFVDDASLDDPVPGSKRTRRQLNLTSARLTLAGWKDGVASGRFEMKTTRGVELDFAFHAALEDRDGALAAAAAPTAAARAGTGAGEPSMR